MLKRCIVFLSIPVFALLTYYLVFGKDSVSHRKDKLKVLPQQVVDSGEGHDSRSHQHISDSQWCQEQVPYPPQPTVCVDSYADQDVASDAQEYQEGEEYAWWKNKYLLFSQTLT